MKLLWCRVVDVVKQDGSNLLYITKNEEDVYGLKKD